MSADTGICWFGPGKGQWNFFEHNCKNGDTAIWRADADKKFDFPHPFIAYNCNLDGKLLQGVAEDFLGYKEAYVICEFQQKVERE